MTDRERLIELLQEAQLECFRNFGVTNTAEIADYLLDNGVIVPLVKVGDTVYIENEPHKVLYMLIENKISYRARFDCNEQCSECSFAQKTDFNGFIMCRGEEYPEFKASDIGKTVFITHEEAEKALKERNNDPT